MTATAILATKVCNKCSELKPVSGFSKKKTGQYGVRATCKVCSAKENREWHIQNPGWRNAYQENYRKNATNEQLIAERDRLKKRVDQKKAYYLANKSKIIAYNLDYAKRYPEKYASRAMLRITLKAKATPSWADQDAIERIYAKAALLTKETGITWHVDHIVPLNSTIVCGMHVDSNLSVIPATENLAKGNRHWPDMP